jgi:hypothetical protein
MFGLNPYVLAGAAAGWALAALMGWAALHEHGVAASQASRDQAAYAVAQAQATASALKQQQAIDAKELAQANKMRTQAEQAVAIANATVKAALDHAATAKQRVRTIIRHEPPSACARQPIPPKLLKAMLERSSKRHQKHD